MLRSSKGESVTPVKLRPFLRPRLDVLFVALNPPVQSNSNGHYFSGTGSRFFKLLFESGLITKEVPKSNADEVIFGSTVANYGGKEFGVVDLVGEVVETESGRVRPTRHHVETLLEHIYELHPRFICIIHSKVRVALEKHATLSVPLTYGVCGAILPESDASVVMNYFPNGNAIPDAAKLQIFRLLRDAL